MKDLQRRYLSAVIVAMTAFLTLSGCETSSGDDDSTTSPPPPPPPAVGAVYDPMPASTAPGLATFTLRGKWQKTDLNYFIYNYANGIPTGEQQAAIRQAYDSWSAITPLTFTEVGSAAQADMLVGFGSGDHCELYTAIGLSCPGGNARFDGPSQVLAHAYFPGQGGLSGETHFDADEGWIVDTGSGSGISLLSVAAHEIGHALGLDHSQDPSALMYPSYNSASPIEVPRADDIAGIQTLYGSSDGSVPPVPPTPPPATPPSVPGCGSPTPVDTDGDGIDDLTELFYLGTDPNDCDTDNDGLPDSEAFAGLNPLNPDTDGDGQSDGAEVAAGSNPFIPDQGAGGGYVPGRYIGADSFGSGIDFRLFPNGAVEGVFVVPGAFGPVSVPLFGGIDSTGQLVILSYDYFFAFSGVPVPGGIQGQLQTAAGGFATWSAGFVSADAGDGIAATDNATAKPGEHPPQAADAWPHYQPVRGERTAPQHPAHRRVDWK